MTAFSLGCAFAPSVAALCILRAFQGTSAALTVPSALALITTNWTATARNKALTIYGCAAGVGGVIGLILGGVFAGTIGWRWLFRLSAIIAGTLLALAVLVVPASAVPATQGRKQLDWIGAVSSTGGVLCLIYVFSAGNSTGWTHPSVITLLVTGVLLLIGFIVVENFLTNPLLPPKIWRQPNLPALIACAFLLYLSYMSFSYFATLTLQDGLKYTAIQTALAFLPTGVGSFIASALAGWTLPKLGPKVQITLGFLIQAAGIAVFTTTKVGISYWAGPFPGFVLAVTGLSSVYMAVNITLLSSVPMEQQGLVGAMFNVALQVGSAIGLSAITAVNAGVRDTHDGGGSVLEGYHAAMWVSSGAAGIAALIALLFVRMV